ncbi:Conserved hypothetical protein [Zobellia galactanivorans]|uniref:Uncharacterized protein n=1 Tax=Zobellia galactanivorans (strain DSM 12802 / CCUG 47099 / CIP 106680 / NCIMB 13871 / Dsij) TaxID=63186 RepID=G0LB08_ZOBGA|nr:Conserved hypothetical protein [Zobellia galactanivorans]
MEIKLTNKEKQYISEQMESGRYTSPNKFFSEVLLIHSLYSNEEHTLLKKQILKGWDGRNSKLTIQDLINFYKTH